MERIDSFSWFKKLNAEDHVLLINPPIQEVRYAWIKWNQPTDLLLLSSKLKSEINCSVEMIDFMLPTDSGRVPMRDLAKEKVVGSESKTIYKTRTYGMPLEDAARKLTEVFSKWTPTKIVITTMTTYWYETLRPLISRLKTLCPNAEVSIMGAYPVYESEHASTRMNSDYLITDFFAAAEYSPDFSLYFQNITQFLHDGRKPLFAGLKLGVNLSNTIEQIRMLRKENIRDFVLFEDNVFQQQCGPLVELLNILEKEKFSINFHGLCGLDIRSATEGIYSKMLKAGYRSLFLEYDIENGELNLDSYRKAFLELRNSNIRLSSGNLAGFIMIGTAKENLETLFKHTFQILEICGSVIPKPYTPEIRSDEYISVVQNQGLDKLTPHVFPLAIKNGITREEYKEFYQHTSFLNEKRLGNSFDFFDSHYCSVALKRSLGKKIGGDWIG